MPENPFPLFDVKMLKYKTNLLHCRCLRELPANPYLTVNVEINGIALLDSFYTISLHFFVCQICTFCIHIEEEKFS